MRALWEAEIHEQIHEIEEQRVKKVARESR